MRNFVFLPVLLCILTAFIQCRPESPRYQDGFCSIGTEQLNTAMVHWSALYQSQNPTETLHLQHEGRGSLVGPAALLSGTCDLAPMSRPMPADQLQKFQDRFGALPLGIPVAVEALVLAIPAEVPLREISMPQIRQIFGNTPASWSAINNLSLPSSWNQRDLKACGINSAADRYQWMKRSILEGHYGDRVLELRDWQSQRSALQTGSCDITYLRPAEVSAAALQPDSAAAGDTLRPLTMVPTLTDATGAIAASPDNIQSGRWPLSRYYYMYLPPASSRSVSGRTLAFVRMILSDPGQAILDNIGLYALNSKDRRASLQQLLQYSTPAEPSR
ncbi:MAG: substrate-binding domain-containing protein [Leptospiraceae bacterium]|nr:substrate-binding domain-containing protein [Leptospiraceae bacterium]